MLVLNLLQDSIGGLSQPLRPNKTHNTELTMLLCTKPPNYTIIKCKSCVIIIMYVIVCMYVTHKYVRMYVCRNLSYASWQEVRVEDTATHQHLPIKLRECLNKSDLL